jgi:predicted nucleic acid-binding protein
MDEIERVLRLKFKWPAPEARDAAFYARETSELIMAGGQNAWPGLPDLNDAHVLDTVVFGGIDIVVTGDKKLKAYGTSALKVQFMDPHQFIETYA